MDVISFVNQFSDPEDDEEDVPTPHVPYNKTPDVPTQM